VKNKELRFKILVPRRVPLFYPFWISINLNKYPYSYCANPHIGLFWTKQTCEKGAKGLMIHFPEHWKIWNIELSLKKLEFRERLRQQSLERLKKDLKSE